MLFRYMAALHDLIHGEILGHLGPESRKSCRVAPYKGPLRLHSLTPVLEEYSVPNTNRSTRTHSMRLLIQNHDSDTVDPATGLKRLRIINIVESGVRATECIVFSAFDIASDYSTSIQPNANTRNIADTLAI